jgi:hypothetical protein
LNFLQIGDVRDLTHRAVIVDAPLVRVIILGQGVVVPEVDAFTLQLVKEKSLLHE